MSNTCIFCTMPKVDKAHSRIVFQTKQHYGLLVNRPETRGHMIVVPLEHCDNLCELSGEEQAKLLQISITWAERIRSALGAAAYRLKINNHVYKVHQQHGHIGHLHMHIIPIYGNEVETTTPQLEAEEALAQIVKSLKNYNAQSYHR